MATPVLALAGERGVANPGCRRQSEQVFVPPPAVLHAETGDKGLLRLHQRLGRPGLAEPPEQSLLSREVRARGALVCSSHRRPRRASGSAAARGSVERILLAEERAHRIAEARVRGVERPGEKDRIRLAPTEDLLPVELVLAEVVEDDGVFQLLRVLLRGHGIVGEVEAQRESDRRQRDSRSRESQRDLPRVIRVDEAVREVRTRVEVQGREPIEVLACEQLRSRRSGRRGMPAPPADTSGVTSE